MLFTYLQRNVDIVWFLVDGLARVVYILLQRKLGRHSPAIVVKSILQIRARIFFRADVVVVIVMGRTDSQLLCAWIDIEVIGKYGRSLLEVFLQLLQ